MYVTGDTSSSGWLTGGQDPYSGGFLVRLSSAGAWVWGNFLYGTGCSIAVDGSSNIYVTGGTGDGSLIKFSSAGAQGYLWSTSLGGSGSDSANAVAVDGSGNVYVTGDTKSSDWISGGGDTTYNGGGGTAS